MGLIQKKIEIFAIMNAYRHSTVMKSRKMKIFWTQELNTPKGETQLISPCFTRSPCGVPGRNYPAKKLECRSDGRYPEGTG